MNRKQIFKKASDAVSVSFAVDAYYIAVPFKDTIQGRGNVVCKAITKRHAYLIARQAKMRCAVALAVDLSDKELDGQTVHDAVMGAQYAMELDYYGHMRWQKHAANVLNQLGV